MRLETVVTASFLRRREPTKAEMMAGELPYERESTGIGAGRVESGGSSPGDEQ